MGNFIYLFYYFFQGILFFQVLFLLVFYAYTKSKESLYFGLFLFFTGINFFISTPTLFYNSTDAALDSWWFKLFNIPLVTMGNIFFTMFLRDFFGTLINNKTLSLIIKYVLRIQWLLFIPFIVLYIFRQPTNLIFNVVNVVGLVSCIWMTIIIVKKRMRYANLVAIGFGCYILGSLLTSCMLILLVQGVHHHLLINTYPLFFVKCGILGIIACYLIAIIKKWYYQAKELSVQKLEAALMAEKLHNQLISERSRIAADMHDDVGAGLSRIRYISASMKEKKDKNDADIDKIVFLSDESVEKMNEIIWALNQGNQLLEELIYYIRSQCSEMVSNAGIEFSFNLPENIPTFTLNWKESRNIYLLVKEAVNNAIKHAGASAISLDFLFNKMFVMSITDNGKGLDPALANKDGNGLKNYEKRIVALNGSFSIESPHGKGTKVIFRFPL